MVKYGLIGKSLDHSWSKEYFLDKFSREGISNCAYENYPLEDLGHVRIFVHENIEIAGLNITIPYKQEIIRYVDELDPVAEALQAVNCIKINRIKDKIHLTGYNTDMAAFRDTLKPLLRDKTCHKALVSGTGGAARAVCHALKELNIGFTIVSRDQKAGVITYRDLDSHIMSEHDLIINATPAGMFPDTGHCPPLPYSYLTGYHLLYDLVYNPAETLFLKKGAEAGARVKNGLEMLQMQAELSWNIWISFLLLLFAQLQ